MDKIQALTVYRLFISVSTKRQAGAMMAQLDYFIRVHGLAWTVTRMKYLSLSLLGKDVPISRTKSGLWKGPFRAIQLYARRDRRSLSRALNVLKFIGIFRSKTTPETYPRHKLYLEHIPLYTLEDINVEPCPVTLRHGPFLGSLSSVDELLQCSNLVFKHYAVLTSLNLLPRVRYLSKAPSTLVGECRMLVDDGALKERYVYSPWLCIQYALDPLYYSLKLIADRLPQLFHNDQEAGKRYVVDLMRRQHCVSVDLVAATDYLPAIPQYTMARNLFPELTALIDFAEDVGFGTWRCPDGTVVQHSVGQPMGLRFSFLLFTIYLCKLLQESLPHDSFCIVGDDLVVPIEGKFLIESLNFSISEHKSIGGTYNEFCGTILDVDGDLKVSRFKSTVDPLSVIDRFGKVGFYFYPASLRRKLRRLVVLPRPVGLGWKPKSIHRLPSKVILELYDPPLLGDVPLYPVESESVRADLTLLFTNPDLYLNLSPQERRRLEKYWRLICMQQVERPNGLLALTEHINKSDYGQSHTLIEKIYGIPADWQSTTVFPIRVLPPIAASKSRSHFIKVVSMVNNLIKGFLIYIVAVGIAISFAIPSRAQEPACQSFNLKVDEYCSEAEHYFAELVYSDWLVSRESIRPDGNAFNRLVELEDLAWTIDNAVEYKNIYTSHNHYIPAVVKLILPCSE